MLGWFGALSRGWQIAAIAAIVFAVLGVYWKHRSDLINKGKGEGRLEVIERLEEKFGEGWEEELTSIADARQQLELDRGAFEEEREQGRQEIQMERLQVAADRNRIRADLSAGLSRIQRELQSHGQDVLSIPADDLDDHIRGLLAELAHGRGAPRDRNPFARAEGPP